MYLKLRIHSWGGFGSQLQALAAALTLRERTQRKIEIVFHTSGVTRRDLEIESIIPNDIKFAIEDDYSEQTSKESQKNVLSFLKTILELLRIVIAGNSQLELGRLKPWTLSLRGHYSNLDLSNDILFRILQSIKNQSNVHLEAENVLHYRLGDLLNLAKGHIGSESIFRLFRKLDKNEWTVLTDSPEHAENILKKDSQKEILFEFLNLTPWDVITIGIKANIFIGTSSKLSIWIALFRNRLGKSSTFLPVAMRSAINNEEIQSITPRILYYQ